MIHQLVLALIIPGYMQEGLPVPSLGYKTLMYKCNAIGCVYTTIATAAVLHYYDIFRLTQLIDNFGHLMTVAMIYGFGISFFMYFITVATGNASRMSGNFVYDLFMGACLNPRIGSVDLKMWAEVRIPWHIVFFFALSGCCKQLETYGYVTPVRTIPNVPQAKPDAFSEYGIHDSCHLVVLECVVRRNLFIVPSVANTK